MNISLENYRALIGNLNAGYAVIDNGQLKKVNNGWFARHFDCFKTTASNTQNRDVTLDLYRALKQAVGKDGSTNAAKNEYLKKVREKLGIAGEGDDVVCTGDRPLERRTIKSIVESFDNFCSYGGLGRCFEAEFEARVQRCAKNCGWSFEEADEAIDFFRNHEFVKIGDETKIKSETWAIVKKGDGPINERIIKEYDRNNADDIRRQFKEANHQIECYDRLQKELKTFSPKIGNTLEAMEELFVKMKEEGGAVRLSMQAAKERLESLKTDGMLRDKFIQYLEVNLNVRAKKFKMYNFHADISRKDMERLVARFETRMLLDAGFYSAFINKSILEQVELLAQGCVEGMDEDYFRAAFGNGD